jgi:membrane-associated phospholipid phosphatase
VPAILIGTSFISMTDNEVFDKFEIHEARSRLTPQFRTHADDYAQYAPMAAVYALNLAGVKGKHDILNQTVLLIKTELLMTAFVFPLKKITAVPRPDTGERNSFPSGHTAQAFAAATFLHKEYGKDHPIYSVLAYTTAAGVGILRVLNNRHWASDVFAGAGIGILSTNLVYLTHQNKWRRKLSKGNVTWAPAYGNRTFLMSAIVSLK